MDWFILWSRCCCRCISATTDPNRCTARRSAAVVRRTAVINVLIRIAVSSGLRPGDGGLGILVRRPPGPSSSPLARDHDSAQHQLTAPDTPWLGALKRAGQAGGGRRAAAAQLLRTGDVGRRLGEEKVRVS